MERKVIETSKKGAYIAGIIGIVATLLMAVAIIFFWEFIRAFEGYGYTGAFLISILGGATIVVPVPMIVVVFALGGGNEIPLYRWSSRRFR